MAVPITLAKAGAPLAAAGLGTGGFMPWAAAACLLAAALLWTTSARPARHSGPDQPRRRRGDEADRHRPGE